MQFTGTTYTNNPQNISAQAIVDWQVIENGHAPLPSYQGPVELHLILILIFFWEMIMWLKVIFFDFLA